MIKSKQNGDTMGDNLVVKTTNIIKLTLIIIVRKQQLKFLARYTFHRRYFFYHNFEGLDDTKMCGLLRLSILHSLI